MDSEEMRALIKNRTKGFYERIILPYAASNEGDIERVNDYLLTQFDKSPLPKDWMIRFFEGIERTETEIALHIRKLDSFDVEINNSLREVKLWSAVDTFNISSHPQVSTGKSKSL